MAAERVRNYLMEHGVGYEVRKHPVAYTTSEVAQTEQIPGREMAKVVMLMSENGLVMAVIPGDKMVDMGKAAAALGVDVRLAEEQEFSSAFDDCETGAEPPFGGVYEVPTLVDLGLNSPRITFDAGTHTETITMASDDYLRLTDPTRVDLVTST